MYAFRREVDAVEHDQRVMLRGMTWKDFEVVLAVRGDAPRPRMYFLDGEIELMSPSGGHEDNKKILARLLEYWALESDVPLEGYGSWTLKDEAVDAGAEPDECYILGDPKGLDRPHLAIEVAWSRGGLSKIEIYRRLGVDELWMMHRDRTVDIHVLDGGRYTKAKKSKLLPALDLVWLLGFLDQPTQTAAVKALRAAMRTGAPKATRPRAKR